MRKSLTKIISAGAIFLTLVGCGQPQYRFNGKIGEEQISYKDSDLFGNNHNLTVVRDGKKIEYRCISFSGKNEVSQVVIFDEKGLGTIYKNDSFGDKVIVAGQEKYNKYLKKILSFKQDEQEKVIKTL